MEKTQEILLNKFINKKSNNENISLNVAVSGNKRLLPEDAISDSINAYDVYLNERDKSNKYRIIFNIRPHCSNVLFNPFTEIIKNEGSTSAKCLNYMSRATSDAIAGSGNVIGKSGSFTWSQYAAIRDTQLSNDKCGYEYHCGIDIFNNHILRSKANKTVNFDKDNSKTSCKNFGTFYGNNYGKVAINSSDEENNYVYFIEKDFNTIDDYMRDQNGVIVSSVYNVVIPTASLSYAIAALLNGRIVSAHLPNHLYQSYEAYSFDDCIDAKLIEKDGWYGFYNPSLISTKSSSSKVFRGENKNNVYVDMDINKTINNKPYGEFIDMYPSRDLFSFTPKYNKNRKRIEKNWQYFITYPSKNVLKNGTENFPFFRYGDNDNISLKAYMIDEGVVNDDGINVLTVYSICQHGLINGDYVNIYNGNSLEYDSAEVINVVDKYIFQVAKKSGNISKKWVEFKSRAPKEFEYSIPSEEKIPGINTSQTLYNGVFKVGDDLYPICESNRCNIDPNAQDIHFKRVVNGVECKYYVRKFSRLPNFKFKNKEVNDLTLYGDGSTLIKDFSKPGYENSVDNNKKPVDFESHIAKMGFANTSYGDDTVEIVFTDDIDTSYLKDNLGRPLSEIYLTVIKNNKGYRNWYGIGTNTNISITGNDVEYSHCFGKVNGSFVLSDFFREMYIASPSASELYDVRDLTSRLVGSNDITKLKGLKTATADVNKAGVDNDEIEFDRDYEYYGDICCYSPVDCKEEIIQKAMSRFNTVQRELGLYFGDSESGAINSYNYFNRGKMYHDELYQTEDELSYKLMFNQQYGSMTTRFLSGSTYPTTKKNATTGGNIDTKLYHTTREEYNNMLNQIEGYYYQPHYKVPIKMVSSELQKSIPIKFELNAISIDSTIHVDNIIRQLYLIKTVDDNGFSKNEKLTLYSFSTNKCYNVIVYDIYSSKAFRCALVDENGNYITNNIDVSNIDDFALLKKTDGVPEYAKIINDGSCMFCWREIVPITSENGYNDYPFTNGAFYVTKNINFYLRRQGKDIYQSVGHYLQATADLDYISDEETAVKYPNFNVTDKINYEPNEIEEC